MMKPQFAALTCVLFSCLSGCSEIGPGKPAAASEISNTHCPIMGGEIDGQTFVEWNGQRVGFCCPPCIDDWNDMADTERTEKLTGAAANTGSSHGHEDHDHPTDEERSDQEHANQDESSASQSQENVATEAD
ncbi:MAG: hypothetical protein GY826_35685 [Fuerstiella sp.]|nr:hypothetical protein [Fuerstiella sp.]